MLIYKIYTGNMLYNKSLCLVISKEASKSIVTAFIRERSIWHLVFQRQKMILLNLSW